MMDSYQFALYFNRAAENAGDSGPFSQEALDRILAYQAGTLKETMTMNEQTRKWQAYGGANANTDWFKEFYNDWVPSQEHSLSISGGSEKTQYTISGSFLDQNGLLRHGSDNFQRYTMNGKSQARLLTGSLSLTQPNGHAKTLTVRPI